MKFTMSAAADIKVITDINRLAALSDGSDDTSQKPQIQPSLTCI